MEHIATPKVENVHLLNPVNLRDSRVGTLYITTTHLIFASPEEKEELWILHMHMSSVEKLPLTTAGSPVRIQCHNFRVVTFRVGRDREAQDIYSSLSRLSRPQSVEELFCFQYRASSSNKSPELPQPTGWNFFEISAEFSRQGADSQHWTLTTLNNDYSLCPTYPKQLMVPSSAQPSLVQGCAKFRSKGRLPVLTYYHSSNGAALVRCAQPLSGLKGRSPEDEAYLNCILKSNPKSDYLYIVDTRPKMNAMYNRAAGKGYEAEAFYPNTKFVFKCIENIHVMRDSLAKLVDACETKSETMETFLQGLDASGYLKHVKAVMEASIFIAEAIQCGTSVIVHCSDGWDRTSQTCALAQLLIDPFYRTIQGFQALIEKEWLSFGHKFTDRCGFLDGDPREVSPIMSQFLDATWQVLTQFPEAFQFNADYLLAIHDHVYSCQFGTFVGNCQRERLDYKLAEKTYSLWGHLTNTADQYINRLYEPNGAGVLSPSVMPQDILFWTGLYCRYDLGKSVATGGSGPKKDAPVISLLNLAQVTSTSTQSLEDTAKHLSKQVNGLKSLISNSKATGAVKKFLPSVVTNMTGGGGGS